MEHQKTNNRIYHVLEKGTKRKGKDERMCRGILSLKIQPQSGIESIDYNIMFSHGFLCDECNELQLQTKECDWARI